MTLDFEIFSRFTIGFPYSVYDGQAGIPLDFIGVSSEIFKIVVLRAEGESKKKIAA